MRLKVRVKSYQEKNPAFSSKGRSNGVLLFLGKWIKYFAQVADFYHLPSTSANKMSNF